MNCLWLLLSASTALTYVGCDHSLPHGGLRSHSSNVLSEVVESPSALKARNVVGNRKLGKTGKTKSGKRKSPKAKKDKTKHPTPPETPTQIPTQSPTDDGAVPKEKPGNPTLNPTKRTLPPSMSPLSSPSASPTVPPSISPTSNPSHLPSANPTANPSSSPSASPSKPPSMSPSSHPSSSPSVPPSMSPSSNPSHSPSTSPTVKWDARIQFNATDGESGDEYGRSVGVSDYTIIVGAPYKDGSYQNSGAAYILKKNENSGAWEETQKITSSNAVSSGRFGMNVALSEEVVVCSVGNGAAYVFEFDETHDEWVETDKLTSHIVWGYSNPYSNSLAVSGKTIVAGSFNNNAVHIFNKNENTGKWVEEQRLNITEGIDEDFGFSVGVSGNVIVVGAPSSNVNVGSAYVYEFNNSSGLWEKMDELSPKDTLDVLYFGWSVGVFENIIVIGAPFSKKNLGAAYIFEKNITGSWVEVRRLDSPYSGSNSYFGDSVGVFNDYAVIGCRRLCSSAYSFHRDLNGNWDEIPKKLQTDYGDGVSVGISGNAIAVGAPQSLYNGSVFIFE